MTEMNSIGVVVDLKGEPSFAIICSFFNKFGAHLGLKPVPFTKLEQYLTKFDESGRVDKDLIDLHVQMMRRVQLVSARHCQWEKSLLKFCSLVPSLDKEYLQLDRFGYVHLPVSTKLAILKCLCDCQFDFNPKFKDILSSFGSADLRLLPVGVDKNGLAYWYQQDGELNVRIYTEEPDDQSGGTWELKVKSQNELHALVEQLKNPESITKDDDTTITEDIDDDDKSCSAPLVDTSISTDQNTSASVAVKEEIETETLISNDNQVVIDAECKTTKPTNSKGTYLDMFVDEKPSNTSKKKGSRKAKEPRVDEVMNEEKMAASVEDKSDESLHDIPDELKPFIDRRILPRRSARSAAISQMKEMVCPSKEKRAKPDGTTVVDNTTKGTSNNHKTNKEKEDTTRKGVNESDDDEQEEENDDEDDEYSSADNEDDDEERNNTSDSDFMPLSELRNLTATNSSNRSGRKRSRGRKRRKDDDDAIDSDDTCAQHIIAKERKKATVETLCKKCDKSSNPEVLLLCDKCDEAWHTWCLRPQLWYVPDDDWFCPKCQHQLLIEKLTSALAALNEALKKKNADDKRKEAAAGRLKREIEYLGISVNNIIPSTIRESSNNDIKHDNDFSRSDVGGDEVADDENKIKRLAKYNDQVKKSKREGNNDIEEKPNDDNVQQQPRRPITPIALSRSRRHVAKVDYNFEAYDELIQEAMDEIADGPSKPKYHDPVRPQGGAGRGKDMANIIGQQQRTMSSVTSHDKTDDASTSINSNGDLQQKKLKKKMTKSHRRLTDLDLDNVTESETDEYEASESESVSEQSTDEYVPSEDDEPRRRTSGRLRYDNRPTQSDDDFVVSGSDSDIDEPRNSKSKRTSISNKRNRKRRRRRNDDESTDDESDDDVIADTRSAKRNRWGPKASSSESDFYSDDSTTKKQPKNAAKSTTKRLSEAGRPLRRARKSVNYSSIAGVNESSDDDEEADVKENDTKSKRPVGALTRPKRGAKISSDEADEDEFKPDDDDDDDEDEDVVDDEEEEQEEDEDVESESRVVGGEDKSNVASSSSKKSTDLLKSNVKTETIDKTKKRKRMVLDSDEEEEDDDEGRKPLIIAQDADDDVGGEVSPPTMVSKRKSTATANTSIGRNSKSNKSAITIDTIPIVDSKLSDTIKPVPSATLSSSSFPASISVASTVITGTPPPTHHHPLPTHHHHQHHISSQLYAPSTSSASTPPPSSMSVIQPLARMAVMQPPTVHTRPAQLYQSSQSHPAGSNHHPSYTTLPYTHGMLPPPAPSSHYGALGYAPVQHPSSAYHPGIVNRPGQPMHQQYATFGAPSMDGGGWINYGPNPGTASFINPIVIQQQPLPPIVSTSGSLSDVLANAMQGDYQ